METTLSSGSNFLTVSETASLLRRSEVTIHRYLRQGRLKSYQPGGTRGRHLIASNSICELVSFVRNSPKANPAREGVKEVSNVMDSFDDELRTDSSDKKQTSHLISFTSGENNSRQLRSRGGKRPAWMQHREKLMVKNN